MKTETSIETFKNALVFTIWEIDDNGERKKFPVIVFGKKKGEAILKHLDEIKEFAGTITTEEIPF